MRERKKSPKLPISDIKQSCCAILKDNCEQHHAYTFDNLIEMDFIFKGNLKTHPRQNEEFNSPILVKGPESAINNLQKSKGSNNFYY